MYLCIYVCMLCICMYMYVYIYIVIRIAHIDHIVVCVMFVCFARARRLVVIFFAGELSPTDVRKSWRK